MKEQSFLDCLSFLYTDLGEDLFHGPDRKRTLKSSHYNRYEEKTQAAITATFRILEGTRCPPRKILGRLNIPNCQLERKR